MVNGLSVVASFCITRQSLELKTSFSSSVIENDVKVNIIRFEPYLLLNFKAPVAET
jgi:hypothetical protein